jgi:metallo-beta-lactamase class B
MTLAGGAAAAPKLAPDAPHACADCDEWNRPLAPFRVFGNTYYVGTAGLSAILVASDGGLILLDGALPQSAPLIDANIQALGFRTQDVRLIVNSHAHFDHAGGIAALQRASGARVAASPSGAEALEQGSPTRDDPQFAFGVAVNRFPAVKSVDRVNDGETLRVGSLAVTAHLTPGHTPGSTTWTWRSCQGERCLDVVYADSLTAVSAPGFRFSDRQASFRRSLETVGALPCDILLTTHPGASGLDEKLERRRTNAPGAEDPLIDAKACRAYAEAAAGRFTKRLSEEKP